MNSYPSLQKGRSTRAAPSQRARRDVAVRCCILAALVPLALAAIMVFRGHPLARAIACAAAAVLLAWIVVQVAIIGYVSWMQPATFAAGLLMLLLISLLPSTASTGRKVQ